MYEQRVRQVVQSPLGLSLRISLRIQIAHRCSLVMGNQLDRAVFVRLTWCYCWVRSSLRGTHPLLVFTMQPTNAA